MSQISVLILAAGKGTRMKSSRPKVLHPVAGIPMIGHVGQTIHRLNPQSVAVIIGHGGEQVKTYFRSIHQKSSFYVQNKLNGTAGAVKQAQSWLKKQKGSVLVTCGDTPLLRASTLKNLIHEHRARKFKATILTAKLINPTGYGRIIRGVDDQVLKIVEELDASPSEKRINEINTGTYCFDAKLLAAVLPKVKSKNNKNEYYLTDALELLRDQGQRIGGVLCEDASETLGVNRRSDLSQAQMVLNRRKLFALLDAGVTIIDPNTTFIDENVTVGPDTTIWPQTFILAGSRIGTGCQIGPWAHISGCKIKNDVIFKASYATDSIIESKATVGPYSHLRPKSHLGQGVHMGNFSETKNSRLGKGSKVNHLSYLGDSKVGKNVNIGAGTITCNYDGFKKFPTVINDHAFIGSNSNLIAPVTIGSHAVVGAGSSISDDVPSWALAVERARTRVKRGWSKKRAGKGHKK